MERLSRSKSKNIDIDIDLIDSNTNNNTNATSSSLDSKLYLKTSPKSVTLSSTSGINKISIYPKVDPILLELPYRDLFSFNDSNTFNTLPNSLFKRKFAKFIKLSNNLNNNINNNNNNNGNRNNNTSINSNNKLKFIIFDDYEIDTWYKSPYPLQFNSNISMYICPHCLSYFLTNFTLNRHLLKCSFKFQPPGREIYRDNSEKISIFEIDGRKNVIFCQNLCLLAKLFLNSKTLYYDVEPFMFYVLFDFQYNSNFKFIGYFSKEKLNSTNYNLSCIMTLPIYQRRGLGNFLIDFSYLLSKREFKLGTPEKPLSDLGLLSYRNYWKFSIIKVIYKLLFDNNINNTNINNSIKISIDDLSNLTGMSYNDVIVGLEQLNCFISSFDNDTQNNNFNLVFNPDLVKSIYLTWFKKKSIKLNEDLLIWKPIILGPSGGINTNSTMVITDHNNNNSNKEQTPMKNIFLIANFLNDDIEDDRDLEDQTYEKINLQNLPTNDENNNIINLDFIVNNSRICYPGMKFIKKNINKNKSKSNSNIQNDINESNKNKHNNKVVNLETLDDQIVDLENVDDLDDLDIDNNDVDVIDDSSNDDDYSEEEENEDDDDDDDDEDDDESNNNNDIVEDEDEDFL